MFTIDQSITGPIDLPLGTVEAPVRLLASAVHLLGAGTTWTFRQVQKALQIGRSAFNRMIDLALKAGYLIHEGSSDYRFVLPETEPESSSAQNVHSLNSERTLNPPQGRESRRGVDRSFAEVDPAARFLLLGQRRYTASKNLGVLERAKAITQHEGIRILTALEGRIRYREGRRIFAELIGLGMAYENGLRGRDSRIDRILRSLRGVDTAGQCEHRRVEPSGYCTGCGERVEQPAA
jgi:hypothetical protein